MCYNEEKEGVSGMKKYGAALMAVLACIALTGCGQDSSLVGAWQEEYFEKTCPESRDKTQYHQVVFYDDGSYDETLFFVENGRFVSDSVSGGYGDYGSQLHTVVRSGGGSIREASIKTPVLDPLPGKFERYGGWNKTFRLMTRDGSYGYRISGDTLFITDLEVELEKGMGSTLSGRYRRVR